MSGTGNDSLGVTVFLTSLLIVGCMPRPTLRRGTKRTDSGVLGWERPYSKRGR